MSDKAPDLLKELQESIDRARSKLPLSRDWANHGVSCSTCDDGGCPDCTDPTG